MSRVIRVRVPASSANLGPGFDCLAAALAIYLDLEVCETGSFAVETNLRLPTDARNLCVQAFARVADPAGMRFRIRSQIPLSGGLGSSAAAIVAGVVAANELFGGCPDALGTATELEGHPDNVAAALHGGFVIATDGRAFRCDVPAGLEAIVVVPEEPVQTSLARSSLRAEVALGDAVFNVAHASLLTLAMARGDREMLALALQDRLHEEARSVLFPRSYELARRAAALGAIGATISGAGPTVLVWSPAESSARLAEALRGEAHGWADVLPVRFEQRGVQVLERWGEEASAPV